MSDNNVTHSLSVNITSKFATGQYVYWMRYNEIVKSIIAKIEFCGAEIDREGRVSINKTKYYIHGPAGHSDWMDEQILYASKDEIIIKMIEKSKNL